MDLGQHTSAQETAYRWTDRERPTVATRGPVDRDCGTLRDPVDWDRVWLWCWAWPCHSSDGAKRSGGMCSTTAKPVKVGELGELWIR